ncbi:MAG: SulP family inorganic anion transporter [Anaerolineae bacterium]|nr:SulP family inorganic anion transporter [Anaerolineae bacterium]MCO5196478.1 SulP family inorganic anion transporter [Anaerolineae bacterium]
MKASSWTTTATRYLLQPRTLLRVNRSQVRADLIAGLTVAVILLPQAIAFALIAELPPEMGIYAAVVAAFVGAMWGSSNQVHTGPTNAISLLVLSGLLAVADAGSAEFILAASVMALLAGIIQFLLGMARLGVLVNFVSHSVIVGFASAAGVLIAIKQLKPLFGLEFSSHGLVENVHQVFVNLPDLNPATTAIGVGTIVFMFVLKRINDRLPAALICMIIASILVAVFGLAEQGVATIGELLRSLPPLTSFESVNLDLFSNVATGALAVAAIALVETTAISRSIATQTGQRLDSNQEFVGQGLANIAVGMFSGYPVAGSFSRSAVNFKSGAQTRLAAVFSGIFVLIALFTLGPLGRYLPTSALAGVLIVTAWGMIDRTEIARITRGARYDAIIMWITFIATLFLHIEFAVLLGILFSFAFYIMNSSVPQVEPVLPDKEFKHFLALGERKGCPQLAIINISGDLYFGAVMHVEEQILAQMDANPDQRYLMLRLHQVNQIDFSGIHMLEMLAAKCAERGGQLYLVRVAQPVMSLIDSTGLSDHLGPGAFLNEDDAISDLFYRELDPAICIYECPVRAFKECQNLPKADFVGELFVEESEVDLSAGSIAPRTLWQQLITDDPPRVIDVREPSEFRRSHVPGSESLPLSSLMTGDLVFDNDKPVVLVCRSGRRSKRAVAMLHEQGCTDVIILDGGMLAWEEAHLLTGVLYEMQATEQRNE